MFRKTKTRLEREGEFKGIKFFKEYYNKEAKQVWFKCTNEPRGLITMVNRLRANHYNLKESLARKNYIEDAICECEKEMQDIYHLVFRCERLEEAKNELYRMLEKLEITYPYNIDDWLKNVRIKPLKAVWTFLNKIGKII
ncbi:unnamed protein product [Lasius platythorax]|uniref:Reverse transcriptase zinc-binding domain-containing protein n=1 Tax=Lasius platythorax TaxID=488582 RepID=A0AAV2NLP2_9HYME